MKTELKKANRSKPDLPLKKLKTKTEIKKKDKYKK